MNPLYEELQWLERPPQDFSKRLKALENLPGPAGQQMQELAQYALDVNQLIKLAKVISGKRREAEVAGTWLTGLVPFRMAVLSNSTIDLIVPALVASAARHGIALEVVETSYDQAAQEVLDPDSKVNRSNPDAVLLALIIEPYRLRLCLEIQQPRPPLSKMRSLICKLFARQSKRTPGLSVFSKVSLRLRRRYWVAWIARFREH